VRSLVPRLSVVAVKITAIVVQVPRSRAVEANAPNGDAFKFISKPDYRQEKQRCKEEIHVHYDNAVPEELRTLRQGKKYLIYTYGCLC
jgi:hypothetical protein